MELKDCRTKIDEIDAKLVSLKEADENSVIFVADLEEYEESKDKIDALVEAGAKIVFHVIPLGETEIFGDKVLVSKCSVKKFNFVKFNPDTDITSDFIKGDVRYWYNEEKDYMTPIIGETFEAEGYEDILFSARRSGEKTKDNPQGAWTKSLVLGRKKYGKGNVYICQASLEHRISKNPIARMIFERMVGKK